MPNYYSHDLKEKILNLYFNKKFSVLNLVKMFDISKSSIYAWINLHKNNNLSMHKKNYHKNKSYFRNVQLRVRIKFYVCKFPNFNYVKLIDFLYVKLNIKICKTTLYDIIKDLNLTKKNIKIKKTPCNKNNLKNKYKIFKKQMKKINHDNVICIDETNFDTNIIHNRAWSIKGHKLIRKIKNTYKRITLICAISNNEILHYKIIKDSANSHIFLDFIKELNNKIELKNKYILLDNAVIHHSKIVNEYITSKNINFIFNVPYSPEYNPIENVFSIFKKDIKQHKKNYILSYLIKNIIKIIKKFNIKHLIKFYNNSFKKFK